MKTRSLDFQTTENKVTVNVENIAIVDRKIPFDTITMNVSDKDGKFIQFELKSSITETNEKLFMPDR